MLAPKNQIRTNICESWVNNSCGNLANSLILLARDSHSSSSKIIAFGFLILDFFDMKSLVDWSKVPLAKKIDLLSSLEYQK